MALTHPLNELVLVARGIAMHLFFITLPLIVIGVANDVAVGYIALAFSRPMSATRADINAAVVMGIC